MSVMTLQSSSFMTEGDKNKKKKNDKKCMHDNELYNSQTANKQTKCLLPVKWWAKNAHSLVNKIYLQSLKLKQRMIDPSQEYHSNSNQIQIVFLFINIDC